MEMQFGVLTITSNSLKRSKEGPLYKHIINLLTQFNYNNTIMLSDLRSSAYLTYHMIHIVIFGMTSFIVLDNSWSACTEFSDMFTYSHACVASRRHN